VVKILAFLDLEQISVDFEIEHFEIASTVSIREKTMFELDRSQIEIQKAARDFARGEFDKNLTLELEEKREYLIPPWEWP